MPIPKPRRLDRSSNVLQSLPIDSDIDIPSKPSPQRINRLDMRKNRKPANDLVRNARTLKRRSKSHRDVVELLHLVLEESVDKHSFLSVSHDTAWLAHETLNHHR